MFTGSAGVNPAYAIVEVFLILAWRNAGYLGLDGFALPMARERLRRSRPVTGQMAPPLPAEAPVS
jgi:thiosulfate dehydrogenase [quinone] large subunit